MATVNVKVPDDMKKRIKELSEEKHYQNESEYVREALRKKIEEDTGLTIDQYREVANRMKEIEDEEVEMLGEEEVKQELGIK